MTNASLMKMAADRLADFAGTWRYDDRGVSLSALLAALDKASFECREADLRQRLDALRLDLRVAFNVR